MSFAAQEDSVADGAPIILVTFVRDATEIRLTASDLDFALPGPVIYTAEPGLQHSRVVSTPSAERGEVVLTFARSSPTGLTLMTSTVTPWTITITHVHETDGALEPAVIWKGYTGPGRRAGGMIEITGRPYSARLARFGQPTRVERQCIWQVYGRGCRLDMATFQAAGTVSAIDGRTLTIAEAAAAPEAGYYRGGVLSYGGELQYIEAHAGQDITLLERMPSLETAFDVSGSEAVLIAPGCPKTRAACDGRFGNILNHLSAFGMPIEDIFGSNIRVDLAEG